jgi:ADP-heptose:LPS heptosyltransferase
MKQPIAEEQVQQVMLIRLGAVGDLMVTTAALEHTLERFPNARVWVAGHPFWKQILIPSRWPRVNGVLSLENKTGQAQMHRPDLATDQWRPEGLPQSILYFLRKCDASVNFRQESLRYAWPAWWAGVPYRLGTCWWGVKWLYTHWEPWLARDPILHERDRLLRIAASRPRRWWPLGLTARNRTNLKLEQARSGQTVDKLRPIQPGQDPQSLVGKWRNRGLPKLKEVDLQAIATRWGLRAKSYVLVNPTGSRRDKAWLASEFNKFCLQIKPWLAARGQEVVITGAPHETEWLREVAGADFKVVQPTDLRLLMDLVGGASALVTTASSMQFFANSQRVPALVIMGRTFPARWGPLLAHDAIIFGYQDPSVTNMYQQDVVAYASISVDLATQTFYEWFAGLEAPSRELALLQAVTDRS